MLTLKFALDEVVAVATHSMLAPRNTLRSTYDQCQNGEEIHAALWWVRDSSGTYLTGNPTHTGAPCDAFAEGYGPGGDDASRILGRDSRVIDAISLHDPESGTCLHSDLVQAQRDGHDTLTISLDGDVMEMRTLARPKPVAPDGLTAYSLGIVYLAAATKLRLTWQTGKSRHVLHLAGRGPHGATGHVVIGARSGKVLRTVLSYPSDHGPVQRTAEGTNNVRALLGSLSPSPYSPDCTAPNVTACFEKALQK